MFKEHYPVVVVEQKGHTGNLGKIERREPVVGCRNSGHCGDRAEVLTSLTGEGRCQLAARTGRVACLCVCVCVGGGGGGGGVNAVQCPL